MFENSAQVGAALTSCSLFFGVAGPLVWNFWFKITESLDLSRSSPFHVTGGVPGLSYRDQWMKTCVEFSASPSPNICSDCARLR